MGISGLNINAKVSGSWRNLTPYVKVNDQWQPVRMQRVKQGGIWRGVYEYNFTYTFSAGEHTDIDLDTLAGLDKFHHVTVIISANATLVASSTSTYALKTGSGYGGQLTIINYGKILGRGGNGGNGGSGNARQGQNGHNGGPAMLIECPLRLLNYHVIAGGGGGGAGGGGARDSDSFSGDERAGGGGGGGGVPYGAAGNGGGSGAPGSAGTAATLTTAGTGGSGGFDEEGSYFSDGNARGGNGGSGGGSNAPANRATRASEGTYKGNPGNPGQPGAPLVNPNNFSISTQ